MLEKLRRFVRAGNLFLGYLSGLGILLMGLILFYEVVLRYFFDSPTIWVQEVSVYLFMWTMLTGASYTLMIGKHVRIDLVFDHFPPKAQCALDVVTSVVGMIFCAAVAQQAYEMIAASVKFGKVSATILRTPMWLLQLPLFLGYLLLALQFFLIGLDRAVTLGRWGQEKGGCANV